MLALRGRAVVTPDNFRAAVGLLASGGAKAEPLVTHRGPLDQIGALAPKFPSTRRKVPVFTSARVANLDHVR